MEIFFLLITFFWVWVCYSVAESKRRNKELWAVLGFFFGIFAAITISLLPTLPL